VNDVVFLEVFARSPRSLIFPINEPMVVKVVVVVVVVVVLGGGGVVVVVVVGA